LPRYPHAVLFPHVVRSTSIRAATPLYRSGWVYEEKIDGWRLLAYKDGARVRVLSRNGVDHTARFPELAAAVGKLRPARLILDGEVGVFDEQVVSQFHLLHDPDPVIVCTPPILMTFGCFWIGNRDLRSEPLGKRRRLREDAVDVSNLIFPIRRLPADGLEAWELVREHGYESLVAKDAESAYRAGESPSWVKVKVRQSADFLGRRHRRKGRWRAQVIHRRNRERRAGLPRDGRDRRRPEARGRDSEARAPAPDVTV
jgi:bifunctional non-homologous end joining protein LigD